MKKTIIVVMLFILLFLFSLALYRCVHSNNKSMSTKPRESEKTQEQLISDTLNELGGLNGGPRPSGFVEPSINDVDSLPTNQVNRRPLP